MKKQYNKFINCLGLCLIVLSNIIALTSSFSFIGEPDVPKSMLK
ncbi:AgrD family cyclic lactone autoinducer peptide [Clostridium botulinum]|nr:cyclic lactone autoinducer peptide [Clostridium botulinum]